MNRYQVDVQVDELDDDNESYRTCYRLVIQGWSPLEVLGQATEILDTTISAWETRAQKGKMPAGAESQPPDPTEE